MQIHRTNAQDIWKRAITARRLRHADTRCPRGRQRIRLKCRAYFAKMRGLPPELVIIYPVEIFWSFIGAFLGIGLLSLCNHIFFENLDRMLLMGTFGASAMLLFGAPQAPFSQPRNVIGGHVVSALVGITIALLLGQESVFAPPLAVSLGIVGMHVTGTLHPPGGGTALLMVTGGSSLTSLGYMAALFPVATGACLLVLTALVTNNLSRRRRYPMHWW